MSGPQHTPPAYRLDGSILRRADGEAIARFMPGANSAKVLRACNAHDALVAALEGVLRVADRKTDEFDAARAAIAKAAGAA